MAENGKNMPIKARLTTITGITLLLVLVGCAKNHGLLIEEGYKDNVGDIEYDVALDDSTFKRCHPDKQTVQYFNFHDGFQVKGEKDSLICVFEDQFTPVKKKNQNGYIRIRFVVNCEGESGQFRVLQSDENFVPFQFHRKIVDQLLGITKDLDQWYTLIDAKNEPRDYYLYLIFKMENGTIKELMP